jgi:hypothetical protein
LGDERKILFDLFVAKPDLLKQIINQKNVFVKFPFLSAKLKVGHNELGERGYS